MQRSQLVENDLSKQTGAPKSGTGQIETLRMQQFETNFDDNERVPGRLCELKYGRLVDRPLCHGRPLRHPRNGAFAESNSNAAQVAYTSAIQLLIILSHRTGQNAGNKRWKELQGMLAH